MKTAASHSRSSQPHVGMCAVLRAQGCLLSRDDAEGMSLVNSNLSGVRVAGLFSFLFMG